MNIAQSSSGLKLYKNIKLHLPDPQVSCALIILLESIGDGKGGISNKYASKSESKTSLMSGVIKSGVASVSDMTTICPASMIIKNII